MTWVWQNLDGWSHQHAFEEGSAVGPNDEPIESRSACGAVVNENKFDVKDIAAGNTKPKCPTCWYRLGGEGK